MDAFIDDIHEVLNRHATGKPDGRQNGLLLTLGSVAFAHFAGRVGTGEALKAFSKVLAHYAEEVPGASVTIIEQGDLH